MPALPPEAPRPRAVKPRIPSSLARPGRGGPIPKPGTVPSDAAAPLGVPPSTSSGGSGRAGSGQQRAVAPPIEPPRATVPRALVPPSAPRPAVGADPARRTPQAPPASAAVAAGAAAAGSRRAATPAQFTGRTPTPARVQTLHQRSASASSSGVVMTRPAVIVGAPAKPTQQRVRKASEDGRGFGQGLISEKSLDEVILAYLSEDAEDK